MKFERTDVPGWLENCSVYQINPRTFSPAGTIAAVTRELSFLRELGIRVIYLCPVFKQDDSPDHSYWSIRQLASETENPKNPYRIDDYFAIDEEYGSMEDLKELVEAAHGLGMRVLFDLVYLHIGPFAPILKTHPEFAKQNPDGSFRLGRWNFPLLDFTSDGLREYLWCNMVYYISVLDVDGFRCDVGDEVPVDFWNEGRRRIRAVKPDAVLIDEGRRFESMLCAFDACYGFLWQSTLREFFEGKVALSKLREVCRTYDETRPAGSLILRAIDNHDTVTDFPTRFETLAGHDGTELVQAMHFTLDGIPMLYCGGELADETKLSTFANRFFPGQYHATDREALKNTPAALRRQEVLRRLNSLRETNPALTAWETEWLEVGQEDCVLAYARRKDKNSVIFVGNFSAQTVSVTLPQAEGHAVYLGNRAEFGETVTLQPHGYLILTR